MQFAAGSPHEGPPLHASPEAVRGAKSVVRRAVLVRRELRTAEQRRADDAKRSAHAIERLSHMDLDTVAAYVSVSSEPGSLQLLAWLNSQHVHVLLPVLGDRPDSVHSGPPRWGEYRGPGRLRVGARSFLEPDGEPLAPEAVRTAQVIICPGLAASLQGKRLGRGGGWYDRALSYADPAARSWLLLNDDEILDAVPTMSGDHSVDAIVTPTRFLDCRSTN